MKKYYRARPVIAITPPPPPTVQVVYEYIYYESVIDPKWDELDM